MKSRVVHLYITLSIWSMVTILGFGLIQLKGEIVRIMIGIHRKSRRIFRDQRMNVHKDCA